MWYVYIAQARTGRFYTGISTNPKERLLKYNARKGSRFAVNQGPLELAYVSLPFAGKSKARKREIQVKNWSRAKKIKLIKGIWV